MCTIETMYARVCCVYKSVSDRTRMMSMEQDGRQGFQLYVLDNVVSIYVCIHKSTMQYSHLLDSKKLKLMFPLGLKFLKLQCIN